MHNFQDDTQPSSSKTHTTEDTGFTETTCVEQSSEKLVFDSRLAAELAPFVPQAHVDINHTQVVASDVGRKGHNYRNTVVKENARAHLGDVHHVYNFNQAPADESVDSSRGPDLLEALSFDGMGDRLMSITPAYAETCNWILDRPEYLRWQDPGQRGSNHGVLWIKGKAGTGKSTLMSCLYDLTGQRDLDGMIVSFFFNARSPDVLVKSTEGMYRSLLHQILCQLPRLKKNLSHLQVPRSKNEHWPIERLESAFRTVILGLSKDKNLTCFVDALDECKVEDVRRAVESFEDLAESFTARDIQFRICFSSRYYPQITMRRHEELKLDEQPEHMQDISRYINVKLAVPPRAKLELSREIYSRCSGIFLWVVLVVKRLREESDSGSTRSKLLAILESTPGELEALFATVVAEPDNAFISIVQWMLLSTRKLGLVELYFAVQTSIGAATTGYWDFGEIDLNSMSRYLLHASRGLMESAPGPQRSQFRELNFIHESVRTYFLSGGLSSMERASLLKANAVGHARLAEGCLTYLETATSQPVFSLFLKNLEFWERHDAHIRLPLTKYASMNFLRHAEIAFANGILDLNILERIPLQHTIAFLKYGLGMQVLEHEHPSSLLFLLLQQDCTEMARALLARTSNLSYSCTQTLCNGYGQSCTHTHTHLTKPDLRKGTDSLGSSLLQYVIGCDREELVRLLLDYGADIDMADGTSNSPLCSAVLAGHHRIVRILLQYGARVDTTGTKHILHVAVKSARKEIVQSLLEKINVNLADYSSRTPLHLTIKRRPHASNGDDVAIARLLLEAGADMEAADRHGNTVLIKAAGKWRPRLVRELLRRGADVKAKNHRRETALHAALKNFWSYRSSGSPGSEAFAMLQGLLDAGADVNAGGELCGSVLDVASRTLDSELVDFLVERGASNPSLG